MIVGVLGGIGAGKSTVVRMFSELGADVVDADQEAHRVLESPEIRDALVEWLGPEALQPDGLPDRRAIARRVFEDAAALAKLESLVHPGVHAVLEERVAQHRRRESESSQRERESNSETVETAQDAAPMLVLDVPLLDRSPALKWCDTVVFVEAGETERLARVRQRGWSEEELRQREAAQTPIAQKRWLAKHVIDNSGSPEATRAQVETLFGQLLKREQPDRPPSPENNS